MAGWFGHTQTLTSISKSVSTVASGILGLEDNLATFMKKVIYYDKFFQRVRANLPKEVTSTATRLFARCYEYRDEVRDELESSLAYVADAGRWVVGMEDWNSKMEKRLHQISELVLLANSLLVEYAMTGKLGGDGSKDELDAYLRNIASSVVLKNQKKKPSASKGSPTSVAQPSAKSGVGVVTSSGASSNGGSMSNSIESLTRALQSRVVEGDHKSLALETTATGAFGVEESIVLDGPLTPLTSATDDSDPVGADDSGGNLGDGNGDDDDDSLNPFARDYQPPVDKHSLESSLASLANESSSRNSSIPDLATYDADADTQSDFHPQTHRPRVDSYDDEPDSPVNLHEYECLDMDSIPKYDAFKPSIRSRVQRMNAVHASTSAPLGTQMNGSTQSLASYHSGMEHPDSSTGGGGFPASMQSSVASSTATNSIAGEERFRFADSAAATAAPTSTSAAASSSASTVSLKPSKRRPNRIMDMNYSYDFQREQDFNPFVSPPTTFLPDHAASAVGGIERISELDLGRTPKIDEEPPHIGTVIDRRRDDDDEDEYEAPRREALGRQVHREDEEHRETVMEVHVSSTVSVPERMSDHDETEALLAALAAAAEDDYNLFGEAYE